jgi:hypothetical protein
MSLNAELTNGISSPVTLDAMVAHIRALDAHAVTADQIDDVLTLITYLQGKLLAEREALDKASAALHERTEKLLQREREHERTIKAAKLIVAASGRDTGRARWFWRGA